MSLSRAHAGHEQQRCCPAAAYVSVPCDMKAPQLCSVVANSERVMLRSVGLKGQTRAQHVSHWVIGGRKKVTLETQMPRLHTKRVGGA